jgi:ERCC4-type nuclease
MPKKQKLAPVFLIDTREKLPYRFTGVELKKAALKTGDYSLEGFENEITVERKSFSDIESCWHSSRFKAELLRLQQIKFPYLVIETDLAGFELRANKALKHFLLGLSLHYGIYVLFVGSRFEGQQTTQYLLTKFIEYKKKGTLNEVSG